jgi:hypothetical protein
MCKGLLQIVLQSAITGNSTRGTGDFTLEECNDNAQSRPAGPGRHAYAFCNAGWDRILRIAPRFSCAVFRIDPVNKFHS